MQFNTFFTTIVSYACIAGSIIAAAAAVIPAGEAVASEAVAPEVVGLFKQANPGCGSEGPFNGIPNPFIVVSCDRNGK